VGFPVALKWFGVNIGLYYLYCDPQQLISISNISIHLLDKLEKKYKDGRYASLSVLVAVCIVLSSSISSIKFLLAYLRASGI
jgi:hypothetical protein